MSVEISINPDRKDFSILPLVDKENIGKELWMARRDKGASKDYYKFLDRCCHSTYFLPKDLQIGDEVHTAVKGQKETKKRWEVVALTGLSIVFKELSNG